MISTKRAAYTMWPMKRHLIHSALPTSPLSLPRSPLLCLFLSPILLSLPRLPLPLSPLLPLSLRLLSPPELVTELYPRRPQLVEQMALPLLWGLLGQSSGSLPQATTSLCKALYDQMGPGLRASAAFQPPNVGMDLIKLLRRMERSLSHNSQRSQAPGSPPASEGKNSFRPFTSGHERRRNGRTYREKLRGQPLHQVEEEAGLSGKRQRNRGCSLPNQSLTAEPKLEEMLLDSRGKNGISYTRGVQTFCKESQIW